MRKLIVTLSLAIALGVGAAGGAQAAGQRANASLKPNASHRCAAHKATGKLKYLPRCATPGVRFRQPPSRCVEGPKHYQLPKVTFVSNAGIRTIKVWVLPSHKAFKTLHFRGQGPTQYTLRGLKLNMGTLSAGNHRIRIQVIDVNGRKVTKTLRLSVCAAPTLGFRLPSAQCVNGHMPYHLPSIKVASGAGIRSVDVTLAGRTLKNVHFHGISTRHLTLAGLNTSIGGLTAGAHTIKIVARDADGKTVTRTLRFTVCTPHTSTPVFTG